tara:strand:+ start:340 stop:591 length:252 start_codon:yes stop_codon:yes gene_type:complete
MSLTIKKFHYNFTYLKNARFTIATEFGTPYYRFLKILIKEEKGICFLLNLLRKEVDTLVLFYHYQLQDNYDKIFSKSKKHTYL